MSGDPRLVFLGSSPFDSAAENFEALSGAVGDFASCFPDGDQAGWLLPCWDGFSKNRSLESTGDLPLVIRDGVGAVPIPTFRVAPDSDDLEFADFGFAETATDSFREFERLRDAGTIPVGARFQVAFPSPLTAVSPIYGNVEVLTRSMEAAMTREVERILDTIPNQKLLISWDLPCEVEYEEMLRHLERSTPIYRTMGGPIGGWTMSQAIESIGRMIRLAPTDVEVGIYLCYGDPDGHHIIEPEDTTVLTEFANAIFSSAGRPVRWLQLPVPIGRDDATYFAPLRSLELPADTTLILGLLHDKDGLEGAKRRIGRAQEVVSDFGISSECGLGRAFDPETVMPFLELHRDAVALLDS